VSEDVFKMSDWAQGVPAHAGPISLGLYQPSPETAEYWNGLDRRELLLKHCPHCARFFHPKRIVCSDCGASDLDWREAAGGGSVYSFSEIHRAPSAAFAAGAPYVNGIVRLDENVYLFTRFVAEPGPIKIDAPARLDFRMLESKLTLPVFLVG
jgi:uncharacterized OB-fold protein